MRNNYPILEKAGIVAASWATGRLLPLLALLLLVSLSSCSMWESGGNWNGNDSDLVPDIVSGRRPIYIEEAMAQNIYSDVPRPQVNGTGLAGANNLLYVVDLGLGVHVYDNTNPSNPVGLSFLVIPGVTTISISGNRMFADNFGDLITIDISDPKNIRVVDRDEGLYPKPLDFPAGFFGFFECYDPAKGLLIGWEEAIVESPKCRI